MKTKSLPTLFVDLGIVRENTIAMLDLCQQHCIEAIGVNKLTCEAPEVAQVLIECGIKTIADSRIQNLQKISHLPVDKMLLRLPQVSMAHETVMYSNISLNSEERTLRALSAAAVALNKVHRVILMHDLGDLREGCFDPEETKRLAMLTDELPGLVLEGIGANMACYGGVEPTTENQSKLVSLAQEIEAQVGYPLKTVSGASSSALFLLLRGGLPKGVNQLRLGSSLLMGIGLNDAPVPGVRQDAMRLGVEIIEVKDKPSVPENSTALDAMGKKPVFEDLGVHRRALAALGKQDVNFGEISALDPGVKVIGGSSDHLILDITHSQTGYEVGDTIYFALSYPGVLQCMTSEYVSKVYECNG